MKKAPIDPHRDARDYFLAALEYGVHPLVPRDEPEPREEQR